MQPRTQQTIYGLHIGKEYEVHIRCRMLAFTKFGDFSDSIFIKMMEVNRRGKLIGEWNFFNMIMMNSVSWFVCLPLFFLETSFPVTLILIFGTVGILILLMLIVISQQHR